jgi:transcriptional regulatory protein LevR
VRLELLGKEMLEATDIPLDKTMVLVVAVVLVRLVQTDRLQMVAMAGLASTGNL